MFLGFWMMFNLTDRRVFREFLTHTYTYAETWLVNKETCKRNQDNKFAANVVTWVTTRQRSVFTPTSKAERFVFTTNRATCRIHPRYSIFGKLLIFHSLVLASSQRS